MDTEERQNDNRQEKGQQGGNQPRGESQRQEESRRQEESQRQKSPEDGCGQGTDRYSDGRWREFEDYVRTLMAENHIVGAAVAVADKDGILYAKGFGVKDLETMDPCTPKTIFGIASVSKSFTSMAIAQLQDKGALSLDDPVVKHIPQFYLKGADMQGIRIRNILSHTTGLPPMKRLESILDFREHVEYLATSDYELLGAPGQYFSYSNDTFLLNGMIIQEKSGQLYRRYMTHHILDAIGMTRSTYNLEELPKMGDVSTPYVYKKPKMEAGSIQGTGTSEKGQHVTVPWPTLGTYEVGGGIRSCALDLARYGQVFLNGGVTSFGNRIVSQEGIARMWNTPIYRVARKADYHLALRVTQDYADQGLTLVQHGGGQPGVSSNFGFVPEAGITVAVLTNVTGVPAEAIWLSAVNACLGLPLDTKESVEKPWDAPTEHLSRFIGTYQCDEGEKVQVVWDEDGHAATEGPGKTLNPPKALKAIIRSDVGPEEFPLKASDERTLFHEVRGLQDVFRFYFDETRDPMHPWAVLAHSRMLRRVKDQ